MTNINKLFRARIGFPEEETISFEKLDQILEKTAKAIPFENLCIMNNHLNDISSENVAEKILVRNEGGLCYELNSLLHSFLMENRFDVQLVFGVVYNRTSNEWSPTGRTHILNILTHKGENFVVDTGFGASIPLKPVPLNGSVVASRNGEFRVKREDCEHGNYILEIKLKHRDTKWVKGYAFDTACPVKGTADLNLVQQIIAESPHSSFNKGPLMTRFTDQGTITLTGTTLTEKIDRKEVKTEVDQAGYRKLAKLHFGLDI